MRVCDHVVPLLMMMLDCRLIVPLRCNKTSLTNDIDTLPDWDAERIQAVLAINVLDPSMGSGHFPVEVMEYIARFLVEQGVQSEETSEADIMYLQS